MAHRDASIFAREIVSLSLGSDVVMDFSYKDQTKCMSLCNANNGCLIDNIAIFGLFLLALLLERRSLVVFSDSARYQWKHAYVMLFCVLLTS